MTTTDTITLLELLQPGAWVLVRAEERIGEGVRPEVRRRLEWRGVRDAWADREDSVTVDVLELGAIPLDYVLAIGWPDRGRYDVAWRNPAPRAQPHVRALRRTDGAGVEIRREGRAA